MRTFLLLSLVNCISTVGSQLTAFALGVWIYQRTGSMTVYALTGLLTQVPLILAAPLAGALVDRWGFLRAMLVGQGGAGLISSALAILAMTEALTVPRLLTLIAVAALFNALKVPALSAATAWLVPKEQLGRANGLVQFGLAVSQVIAPAGGGLLLTAGGLGNILVLDVLSFTVAIGACIALGVVRGWSAHAPRTARRSLFKGCLAGWRYVRARRGLTGMLLVLGVVNFNLGMMEVLLTPMVLSFADARTLGVVLSIGGVGMIFGGLVLLVWGGPRRAVHSVLGLTLLQGLLLFLGAARPSTLLVAIGVFGFLFAFPIIAGSSQTFWQRKVPPDLQGSVAATRVVVAQSAMPLACALAGPLTDHVFEPLMADKGALADSVGRVLGVGPGRGIALQIVTLGLLAVGTVAVAALSPRLRDLDHSLPDHLDLATGATPPTPPTPPA